MRKSQRQQSSQWALEVLRKAPYVTMSMVQPDGRPYGLPLSIVVADEETMYFHCASEGHKIDCITANPVVALSAVSKCTPAFETERMNYTEHYHSATAVGVVSEVVDAEEKIRALKLLCERFLPRHMEHFDAAIQRSLSRTAVYRINLTEPPVGKLKE